MLAESRHEDFFVKDIFFNITHVKFRTRQDRKHVIAYCAGERLVVEETLDIPGLTSSVSDELGQFRYAGYVVSKYLDSKVREERTGFDIEDDVNGLFIDEEVSRNDIRDKVQPLIQSFLGEALDNNIKAGAQRLQDYVTVIAPQYKPIVKYLSDDDIFVDPNITDAQLDRLLHSKKYQIEQSLLEEGSRLLKPDLSENVTSYSQRIASYMDRAQTIKQSDLASYVVHRRVVLDILKNSLKIQPDGTFKNESAIHNLIFPMNSTSDDLKSLRANNLWLLNERLAFHQHYLGSDKSLSSMPFTDAKGGKEPDILSLNIYDNPHLFSDTNNPNQVNITVVEIKKPMRNNDKIGEDKDPIEQALGYIRRIREGKWLLDGRKIPKAADVPGYIYVLADLTETMRQRCEYATLKEAPDGLSYFGWNGNQKINAYIEVIDFGGLLAAATQRNSAFFEQLGLPNCRNDLI